MYWLNYNHKINRLFLKQNHKISKFHQYQDIHED